MDITKFDRDQAELELFWLFGILCAGKDSDVAARALSRLLRGLPDGERPIPWLIRLNGGHGLHNALVASRIGQYGRIERAITQSAALDLASDPVGRLESVHGVGPKTSRLFVLHSREDARCAVLDVHILQWMRERGGWTRPGSPPRTAGPTASCSGPGWR